jgi:hypothetical protein
LQPVWDSKESIVSDDFFNGDPLLVSPIPDEKVCLPLTSHGISFNTHKSRRNLLDLLDNIQVLCQNPFNLDPAWQILASQVMVSVVHNKVIESTL